jgi:hypothetical protein
MMFGSVLIAAAALLGASAQGQAEAPQAQASAGLELVDFTDDFARIYDRDAALPDAERVARFRAEFATILPGFYDAERVGLSAEDYDAFVLKGLKQYPEQRAGIARVSKEFATLLAPAQRRFEAEFGPMTGYPAVYLVDSFGEFDGGTRELGGTVHLMFGAEMIDHIYKDVPVQPFFHHELFHLYHGRTFEECDPIWCSLWAEGLAVYVSSQLNAGATDAALLLTFPVPLRPAVEAHRQEAVCAVLARLDSTDSADYRPLFNGGGEGLTKNLPRRFGDYVGYLVAQDLGRTRSLHELAALTPAQVHPLIEASLKGMATCADEVPGERG